MRKVQFLFSLKASLKQNHKCAPLTKKNQDLSFAYIRRSLLYEFPFPLIKKLFGNDLSVACIIHT